MRLRERGKRETDAAAAAATMKNGPTLGFVTEREERGSKVRAAAIRVGAEERWQRIHLLTSASHVGRRRFPPLS